MATQIDARVKQKTGVEADFAGYKLLDGEIALVRASANGPVINFKVGPGNFDELEWSLQTPGAPITADTSTSFPADLPGLYVPTENGTYGGSVTVDMEDGYQVLVWDGSTLTKVLFPINMDWYAAQVDVDGISTVIQEVRRLSYVSLPYHYYNNADNVSYVTSSGEVSVVNGPDSDVFSIESPSSSANVCYFDTGVSIETSQAAVVLVAKIKNRGSSGCSIGIGYSNTNGDRGFVLRSGDTNGDIIRCGPRATTVLKSVVEPIFTTGDVVRVEAYFTGTTNNEQRFRFYLNGEMIGEVVNPNGVDYEATPTTWSIVLRGDITAEVAKIYYYRPKIVTADYIDQQLHPAVPVPLSWAVLPDGAGGAPSGGFTCTGLDRITRGTYAGCWLVGNDGRTVEGDGSPYDPHVYIMDRDFRRILKSMPMPYSGASVQGVAVDTSGSADTFWVATAGDGKIRHFDMNGDEITGDVFDWAAEYPGLGNPNGLAYDPVNDALWCSDANGNAKLISCDPGASPRELDDLTLTNSPDMLHYKSGVLYYSHGNNGQNGSISRVDVSSGAISVLYSGIPLAQAIEGIYIDSDASYLYMLSDGGFHTAANPALNIYLKYRI